MEHDHPGSALSPPLPGPSPPTSLSLVSTYGCWLPPKSSPYTIEYTVFKPVPGYPPVDEGAFAAMQRADCPPDAFAHAVREAVGAIGAHPPQRISRGSLGSYFVHGASGAVLGVFKPKDEEPYGPLSPKWTKWLHRTFFPCFFGRLCLIPNLGYVSEAAASVLDRQLASYLVPQTQVVALLSDAFYYPWWRRQPRQQRQLRLRQEPASAEPLASPFGAPASAEPLASPFGAPPPASPPPPPSPPPKIGSFQLYLRGYTDAQHFFHTHPLPPTRSLPPRFELTVPPGTSAEWLDSQFRWSVQTLALFRHELEKLVILDYIMRNTDRGLDNWMIKMHWEVQSAHREAVTVAPRLCIGAIDSGLAFPWKHPDEWRLFPFGWLFLPMSIIGHPFLAETRRHYLPLLTLRWWWQHTVVRLRQVFETDGDFNERMWLKQLAVIKGQAYNVVEVLRGGLGPLELTRRPQLLVWDEVVMVPQLSPEACGDEACGDEAPPPMGADATACALETTPLLGGGGAASLMMSGFDYVSGGSGSAGAAAGPPLSRVVVERLQVSHSKPTFTWC
jgi:phosphatidylinositol 4-kinase type 2